MGQAPLHEDEHERFALHEVCKRTHARTRARARARADKVGEVQAVHRACSANEASSAGSCVPSVARAPTVRVLQTMQPHRPPCVGASMCRMARSHACSAARNVGSIRQGTPRYLTNQSVVDLGDGSFQVCAKRVHHHACTHVLAHRDARACSYASTPLPQVRPPARTHARTHAYAGMLALSHTGMHMCMQVQCLVGVARCLTFDRHSLGPTLLRTNTP